MKALQFLLVIAVIIDVALADNAQQRQIRRSRRPARPAAVVQQSTATAHPLEDTDSARTKRSYDKWLEVISQFARRGEGGATPWSPFPVDLPVTGKDGKVTTLPVLILPIPVPVPGTKEECSANHNNQNVNTYASAGDRFGDGNEKFREDNYKKGNDRDRGDNDRYRGDNGIYREDNNRRREENKPKEDKFNFRDETKSNKPKNRFGFDVRFGEKTVSSDELTELNKNQRPNNPELPPAVFNNYVPQFIPPALNEDRQYLPPAPEATVSSDYLIELYRKQRPDNPELPPAVFNNYAPEIIHPYLKEDRHYLPPAPSVTPSRPRFDRSIKLRGFLTAYRSDYTEEYTAWYDASSGATRMDYHGGASTSYRTMTPDGRVQRFMRNTDRTGEKDIVTCSVTSPGPASPEDRAPPALPNIDDFTFGGYREEFGGRVEVWLREMKGRSGELGAVKGEELTYRHELIVSRKEDDFPIPLRYKVAIDSSILGHDSDGYEHVYSEVLEQEHDPEVFGFNPDQQCEQQEKMNPDDPNDMARLEPMRDFTMPFRDPRYEVNFESYTKQFERKYSDEKETALRNTLLIQKNRFISSSNRQSGSFTVGVNFLSDRLDAELEILLGASYSAEAEKTAVPFPLDDKRIQSLESSLPKEFDWRPLGGVTPVKFQGASCSSCWAFAVVGAVEGALFIRTSRLVELSEQSLVDCGHSHKANGCNGTWPAAAFNYVKDRGLPARDEYTPYMEKKLECKAPPVPSVTHISGHSDVPPNNINALKVAIRRFAPTVVVVDAHCETFIHYTKGVLHDDRCIKSPKKKLNHAVLAVGWGELKNEPHFIIKNSWHEKWGEGGYIRLHAPSNTCGVLTTPNYPRLRRADVDKLPSDAHKFDEEVAGDNERR